MTQPSQALDKRQPTRGEMILARVADDFEERVKAALPENVSLSRFVSATKVALVERPELANADQGSLFSALLRCAQMGLMPDGREAAINVYRSKVTRDGQDVWIEKAELLPMIGGYRKVAADFGWTIRAAVVYAADDFEFADGIEPTLRHVPARPGQNRGDRVAVYAIATKRGESPLVRVLYPEDVARAKKSSKTDKVWNEHTDRMWEKTAGKLLFKSLPLGSRDIDRQRIEALVSDDADAAAQLVYGSPMRRELDSGTPAEETTPTDADEPGSQEAADSASDGGPQAESGGTDTAAAPAPGDDDEPEPGASPTEDPELAAHVETATGETIPYGGRAGQTIADVAAAATDGDADALDWLLWAVGPSRRWAAGPFGEAVRTVVEHRFPAVWAKAQAKYAEALS